MDLETYLKLNKLSILEFAVKAKLSTGTVYSILDGNAVWEINKEKVEKATEGKVKVQIVDRRQIAKKLKKN